MNINVEYTRKNEGIYYGEGAAMVAEAVAIAAHGAKPKGPKAVAEAVYGTLRLICAQWGMNADIETSMRDENGGWRVSWECGPYAWAMPASSALAQCGILAEPYYSFDLCFYAE